MAEIPSVIGEPTWFGPDAAPLFGVVHTPPDGRARSGIVLCPPVGKEHVDTYRGVKMLAQDLCDRGFAVLRFDYLATGDSAVSQRSESAVAGYLDSIRHAVAYLRDSGARTTSLVGLRLGALLAARVADGLGPIDGLVLWDPVSDGRRYLREQRVLYKMTVGEDVEDDGGESILGISFAPAAATELARQTMPSTVDPATKVLLAVRPERRGDKRLTGLSAEPNCTVMEVSGQAEFVEPMSFVVEIPVEAVSAIASWLDAVLPDERSAVTPTIRRRAVVAGWDTGAAVIETFDALGEHGLFAIRTSAVGAGEDPPTLLLHNTACEHRVGTGRVWTEAARDLAASGMAVVRYDRRGTGDTGIATAEFARIHSTVSKDDAVAAVDAVAVRPDRLMMAGVCSGAWHSAHAATARGAKSVVLVNAIAYAFTRVEVGPEKLTGSTPAAGPASVEPEPRTSKALAKRLIRRWTPYRLWLFMGRHGFTQVPEVLLGELQRRDVSVDVVLSPHDYDWFVKQHGPKGVARLARRGRAPRVIRTPTGDHPLLQRDLQNFTRRQLTEAAAREFGADVRTPGAAVRPAVGIGP